MKRKTFSSLIFALALFSITLWSCDSLFVNQFAEYGLGQVDMEEVTTAITDAVAGGDATSLIEQSGIQESGVTKTFVEAVVDSGKTEEVITILKTVITDTGTTLEEKEAAAVVIIEILIAETGETDLLDNLIVAATSFDFTDFDITDPADLERLLDAILPPGAKTIVYPEGWDGARLAGLLDALEGMAEDFFALAERIEDNSGTLTNFNLDPGWYAQVGTLVSILNALELQATLPEGVTTKGEAIVFVLENVDLVGPEGIYTTIEALVDSVFSNVGTIVDTLQNDYVINQLFLAAGIDFQAILEMVG